MANPPDPTTDPIKYNALMRKQEMLDQESMKSKTKPPPYWRLSRILLETRSAAMQLKLSRNGLDFPAMRTGLISMAYPPCLRDYTCLSPIYIDNLRLETHHRGHVLIVRIFCPPVYVGCFQASIEDGHGNVDRLRFYNVSPFVSAQDVLPQNRIFAIKEPFYKLTASSECFVRVDHPSDLVMLRPGDPIIPPKLAAKFGIAAEPAVQIKEKGNAAFKRGSWLEAVNLYSDAIAIAHLDNDEELERTVFRNRAAVQLRLGRYEMAIKDSLHGMVLVSEDASQERRDVAKKANLMNFFRMGRANYEMQNFENAKKDFEAALRICSTHTESAAELHRIKERLEERENGIYDFSAMSKSATKEHTLLDHASFLKNTVVRTTGNHSLGLFATKDLAAGEVVLVEKAFLVAHDDKSSLSIPTLLNCNSSRIVQGSQTRLFFDLIEKMLWNPMRALEYLQLDGSRDSHDSDQDIYVVEDRTTLDIFRVKAISETNSIKCPRVQTDGRELADGPSSGIWIRASLVNHKCISNVAVIFIGDMLILRACKPIREQEEIFIGYINPTVPLSVRGERIQSAYDFTCSCELCEADTWICGKKTLMEKRQQILARIDTFMHCAGKDPVMAAPQIKARGIKLLQSLRATYPPKVFGELPRLDCARLASWVCRSTVGNSMTSYKRQLGLLRDTGYFVSGRGQDLVVNQKNAVPTSGTTYAVSRATQYLDSIGDEAGVATLTTLAKALYTCYFVAEHGPLEILLHDEIPLDFINSGDTIR